MSSSSCAIGHRTTPPGCRLCGDIVNAQREAQPDPDRAFQASTNVRRYGASQLGARKAKQFDHEHSQLGDIWQKVAIGAIVGHQHFDVVERPERSHPALHKVDWHFDRSEEHTSELQSLMRISYAVFGLKKK